MYHETLNIKNRFSRSASTYLSHGNVQREIAKKLLTLCEKNHGRVLDVGAGCGFFSDLLRPFCEELFLLDISHELLKEAQWHPHQRIQGDFNRIPFPNESLEGLGASMALQWSLNPQETLEEWGRVLRPEGFLYLSLPLLGTFHELHEAGREVNANKNHFFPLAHWQDFFDDTNFVIESAEEKKWCMNFSSMEQALHSVKATGVSYVKSPHHRTLRGRGFLDAFKEAYENFLTPFGQWPLTYQIGFLKVRKK
jgi:malonyl-CoA O-methyltransferase